MEKWNAGRMSIKEKNDVFTLLHYSNIPISLF
jgi:hypothetical protein